MKFNGICCHNLVIQFEFLEANPHYALIRYWKGATEIVPVQDLAPFPTQKIQSSEEKPIDDYYK